MKAKGLYGGLTLKVCLYIFLVGASRNERNYCETTKDN